MSMDTYDEDLISLISMGIYECEWGIYDEDQGLMSIYDEDFKNEGLHGKGYKRERGKK